MKANEAPEQYINKSTLVAELKKRFDYRVNGLKAIDNGTFWKEEQSEDEFNAVLTRCAYNAAKNEVFELICFLDTLEVKDPYEQCVQYDSIKAGIQAHAETYSFNIESELFNQLTKEQQTLWRKEIEQAVISGGEMGVELSRDMRYKENLEVKEVDFEKELNKEWNKCEPIDEGMGLEIASIEHEQFDNIAKHFFELGMRSK